MHNRQFKKPCTLKLDAMVLTAKTQEYFITFFCLGVKYFITDLIKALHKNLNSCIVSLFLFNDTKPVVHYWKILRSTAGMILKQCV